jgi:hypothetical protein
VTQTEGSWINDEYMAAEPVEGVPFEAEAAFLEIPVCVSVVCVVVHLLQVAHQLKVWVSVFFVVEEPGAGGVERHPGFLSCLLRSPLRCWGRCER